MANFVWWNFAKSFQFFLFMWVYQRSVLLILNNQMFNFLSRIDGLLIAHWKMPNFFLKPISLLIHG